MQHILAGEFFFFFFNDTATTEIYTLSLHDALPILLQELSIRLQEEATLLLDASGRVITFDQPLVPGGQLHSASEDLWLLRGGSMEPDGGTAPWAANPDRKSTRLNSSHLVISYAVFCLTQKSHR